ncbi:DNA primase [Holosporaceae bacterium 'Namur']|nr:DNA primase [Holosporaceae bacterium 'Namur']
MSYAIDQVKARINLSSIVSKKVALKRKTTGEYLGLCPFHSEKSPSFNVSDNKGFYHCFGCGAHGDVFSYLMETEYLKFPEALERLAQEAGIELPKHTEVQKKQQDIRDILIEIHEAAANYYTQKLFSPEGKQALNYLKKRGLKNEIIAEYRLGFTPPNHYELYDLLKKKFDENQIISSKILLKGDYGMYNPLKNRVIFPIFNKSGKIVAFGGRLIEKGEPKYLNSPETLIFKKSETLYGLNFAKKEALKSKQIIVVEGYMDVIALANNEIYNSVAPLGTSISTEHIKSLWKIVDIPTLCLDADNAGRAATSRLASEILPFIKADKTLNFASLTGGKDPDEVILNKGREFFNSIINHPIPLSELLFTSLLKMHTVKTPENVTTLRKNLELLAKKIIDKDLQKSYSSYFKNKVYEILSSKKKLNINKELLNSKHNIQSILNEQENNILTILAAIINHPEIISDDEIYYELHDIEIRSNFLDKIREYILNLKGYINYENEPCRKSLRQTLEEQFNFKLNDSMFDTFAKSEASSEEAKEGIIRIFKLNNLIIIQEQIKTASQLLMERQDEETYNKLSYLKQIEEILKTELNILN